MQLTVINKYGRLNISGIYKFSTPESDSFYIGSSNNVSLRLANHKSQALGGKYSKLTVEQVKEIKLLVGTKTDKEISEIFNCSRVTINQIKNNKIWKEV